MSNTLETALKISVAQTGLENLTALIGELKRAGVETDAFEKEAAGLGEELRRLAAESGMVDAFKALKLETQAAEKAMADAKARVAELAREQRAAGGASEAQERAFAKARTVARDAIRAYEDKRAALHKMRVAMRDSGIASTDLALHQTRLRKAQEDLARRGEALTVQLRSSAEAAKVNAAAAERASKAWQIFRTGLGAGLGFAAAQLGVGGITATLHKLREGILDVARVGGQFEALRVQLQTLYGTAEQADQAFAWIKRFTSETPFELEQVTQGFIKLKAMGMDPMDGTFQAIADQASALGASGETLNGIVLALGQAWSKQKLQGEEALQLIERGVPVWDLMSRATGKTTAELQELSAKGLLGRDAIRALVEEMGRMNAGAAERAMQTLNGQIANLKDNWTNFLNLIAESGALEFFSDELKTINAAIKEMEETGELKVWAKEAADAIRSIGEAIKSGVLFVAEYGDALITLGKIAIGLKALAIGKTMLGWGADALTAAGNVDSAADRMRRAGAVAASGWVGWQIGSYLKDEFETVEKIGIATAAGLTKAAARAQGAWEMLQAIGNDDTVAAAYDRMQQKLQQIDDEYAEIFAQAGRTSAAQVEGANAAAEANELVVESLAEIPSHAERAAEEIKKIAAELETGGEAAEKAREQLEKLSAVDLSALAEKARVALEAGTISAEEFARVNDEVLIESFRRLGVDGVVALGGISDASQEAIDAVDRIAASLKAAKEGAETAGPAIEAALTKAFAVADNLPALEKMVEQMEALGRSGQLGAAAMARLADEADKARARIEDMTPGIQSVEEAMRKLGVTSQKELDRAASVAKEAFEQIRKSGTATERELRDAFTAYARAAIEANEGVVDATVAAQAAALGLKVSVDEAGKVIVQSFKEAREAAKTLAEEEAAAADEAKRLGEEAEAAAKKTEEAARKMGATAAGVSVELEKGLTVPWLTGAAAASRYASEAIEAAERAAAAWSNIVNPYEAMETYARRYIAALEDLDRRQAELGSSAARSLDDAKLRLLELTGSEEEIAKAREARDRAEIERQIAIIQLEMQRARLRSDSAEAERLEAELRLLREHLDVLGQIHRAEARQREGKSTKSGGGVGMSGGGGAEVSAPGVRPQVSIVVNNTIEGLLDVQDRGSLDQLGRRLAPIWADLQRRGAF